MSKFRKIKLASAMLCTLLFGGNAGAMQKDVSKGISSDKLKDNLLKGQTENKELENRKPGDSSNPLLKYVLYVLGFSKLADEGVGVAEVKEYIEHRKHSPLGKLSIYKNLVARSYREKTIETMRNLVAESYKNAENIKNFFDKVVDFVFKFRKKNNFVKVENRENLFDIKVQYSESNSGLDLYLDIRQICVNVGLVDFGVIKVPAYVEEYVKAVSGVFVDGCDKILVNVCNDEQYRYIAFVTDNICLKLSPWGKGLKFCLTGISEQLGFDHEDYELDLYEGNNCYAITLPYMEKILGVKHDKNYINIKSNSDKISNYSFYGQIFCDLLSYWKDNPKLESPSKIFPDLFEKELKIINK